MKCRIRDNEHDIKTVPQEQNINMCRSGCRFRYIFEAATRAPGHSYSCLFPDEKEPCSNDECKSGLPFCQ
jgi:hypothetical protein